MKTIEYKTIDKSKWGDGPWQSEPDKKQWLDEETGYPCLIVRNGQEIGALCGYVGVHKGHPAFRKDYDAIGYIDVHGGLTFANTCGKYGGESEGICHVSSDKRKIWWFGFDCAHLRDLAPGAKAALEEIMPDHLKPSRPDSHHRDDVYRDFDYVTNEVRNLAKQLKAMEAA